MIAGAAYMFLTIGVVAYLIVYPEIVLGVNKNFNSEQQHSSSFEDVMKVLREDEKKICLALQKEGGSAMQNDVRWATGLSKVKTHRVVARLAGRGVIRVVKEGRKNRLSLASWLYVTSKNEVAQESVNLNEQVNSVSHA